MAAVIWVDRMFRTAQPTALDCGRAASYKRCHGDGGLRQPSRTVFFADFVFRFSVRGFFTNAL